MNLFSCCRRSRSRSNSSHSYSRSSKVYSSDTHYKTSRSSEIKKSQHSRSKSIIQEESSKSSRRSSSSSSFESDKKLFQNEVKDSTKSSFDDCDMIDNKTLDEINEDKFTPKQFNSSKLKKVPDNILIDLKKNTIKVPEVEISEPDTIFYYNVSIG